jgi:hypothetical protein
MSQLQNIYAAPLPKKAAAKVSGVTRLRLEPGERSECMTDEADIEQRLKKMCSIRHACKIGLEGIVSKRVGFRDRSGSSLDWIKSNDLATPAVRREAEEDRER